MTRQQHYAETWDGTCCVCGANYFESAPLGIPNGCLSCLAQWQDEIRQGLQFDEDPSGDPDYIKSKKRALKSDRQ